MNVTITENPRLADIEVTLACPRIDERVQRIVAGLNAFDRKLAGERDGATYRLDIDDVCYAETVDGRTFLYTEDAVSQTPAPNSYAHRSSCWRTSTTWSPSAPPSTRGCSCCWTTANR